MKSKHKLRSMGVNLIGWRKQAIDGGGAQLERPEIHMTTAVGEDFFWRRELMEETFKVSRKFIDKMHIVTTHGTTFTDDEVDRWFDLGVHSIDYTEETNPAFAHLPTVATIPWGDWVLLMDSDERPGPELLSCIRYLVDKCDEIGVTEVMLPQRLHMDDGIALGDKMNMNNECHIRLTKKVAPYYLYHMGCHYRFMSASGSNMFWPQYYNHYKSESAWALSRTVFWLMDPEHHSWRDDCKFAKKVQAATGCYSVPDFYRLLRGKGLSLEVKNMIIKAKFDTTLDSKDLEKINWINTAMDRDFIPKYPPCDLDCCDYSWLNV